MNRRTFLGQCLGAVGTLYAGSLLGAASCWAAVSERQTRVMLGTIVDISVADRSLAKAQDAIGAAFDEAVRMDALLSRYNSDSPLSELNRSGHLLDAPRELLHVLEAAREIRQSGRNAFNVTVQPIVDYLRSCANPRGEVCLDKHELAEVRALADASALKITGRTVRFEKSGMGITLDGIAKGYIADRMAAILAAHGINGYLVNAGGDIRAYGLNAHGLPWNIAVESPKKDGVYPAVVALRSGAVATSGNYEHRYNAYGSLSHLVDPQTGSGSATTASVSVCASSAMRADALATALSIMPAPHAVQLADSLPDCECLILMMSGHKVVSRGWYRFSI